MREIMREKFSLLILISFLSPLYFWGCSAVDHIPSRTYLNEIDLRKYSDAGFMITPEKIDYQKTIAMLNLTHHPALNRVRLDKNPEPRYKWEYDQIERESWIDSIYNLAKSMGADAIMNFKIEYEITKDELVEVYYPIIKISGLAVKRKQ